MRKLVYFVAVSIDGFIAAPDGSFDEFRFEGGYRDLMLSQYPEALPAPVRTMCGIDPDVPNARFDTVLMGRETYAVGEQVGLTSPYPQLRQYVASRTMTESPDPAVELVRDPTATVRTLKKEDGLDIWLCGGTRLARALQPEIDELIVKVSPVVFGAGLPLFGGDFLPHRFELIGHDICREVAIMRYARA